jgi:hypothetical protein
VLLDAVSAIVVRTALVALETSDRQLIVRLSCWEKAAALRSGFAVPLEAVAAVSRVDAPWSVLRGWRAPGTGLPGVIAYGTMRYKGSRDFAAVLGKHPGVCVDLHPGSGEFERIIATVDDPNATAEAIRKAAGL